MASSHGYFDGSYDYKQMYDIKDINGPLPVPSFNPHTLLGYLHFQNTPFADIISRTTLAGIYNDTHAQFTLFVPTVLPPNITTADSYFLRQLVLYHTLEHTIPLSVIQNTKCMRLNTRLNGSRILVENRPSSNAQTYQTTLLNHKSTVLSHVSVGKSQIFFIDFPLVDSQNPMSNIDI